MSGLVRTNRPPAPVEPVAGEKYTVLLLDEAQLDRFLRRTGGVPSLPPARRAIDVWPPRIVRPLWVVGALVAVLAGTAAAWLRASPGDGVSPAALDRPVVATGASFNVTVASFGRDTDARALALRLGASGLPAYDWRVDGGRRQVLLGPYVSIEEAEEAQRVVRASGFIATRLHVDERLRSPVSGSAAGPRVVPTTTAGDPALVLVAAPGRVALALELADEPREVVGRRLSGDTYEVLIRQPSGWLREPAEARLWGAPPDVPLLRDVTLQEVDPGNSQNLRLRLAVPETTGVAVRTVGRRVYVDLARVSSGLFDVQGLDAPDAAAASRDARARPAAVASVRPAPAPVRADVARPDATVPAPAADARAGEPGDEDAVLAPIRARFEEIQPFLRSAAAAPDPTVLDALRGTLTELERELRAAAPRPGSASRGLLVSAIELAKEAVARDFAGDRAAQVREATAQFAAARPRPR